MSTEAAIARFDLGQEFSPGVLQEAKRSKAHTADKCSQQEDFIVRPQEAAL